MSWLAVSGSCHAAARAAAFVFPLLAAACASAPDEKPDPALGARLDALLAAARDRNAAVSNLAAEGIFRAVEPRNEVTLAVRLKRDPAAGFTRVEFRGTLNDEVYAEVVVQGGRARLWFAPQKRLFAGPAATFDLFPFARVHVTLAEVLRLGEGRVYLADGWERRAVARAGDLLAAWLVEPGARPAPRWQKVFFDGATGLPTETRLYEGPRERGRVAYGSWIELDGRRLPRRAELAVPELSLKVTLWMTTVRLDYRYAPGDERLDSGDAPEERP